MFMSDEKRRMSYLVLNEERRAGAMRAALGTDTQEELVRKLREETEQTQAFVMKEVDHG